MCNQIFFWSKYSYYQSFIYYLQKSSLLHVILTTEDSQENLEYL